MIQRSHTHLIETRFVSQLSDETQDDYSGALGAAFTLALLWGMMAYGYAMYVSYCGVYGRWCFGHYPSVLSSLTVRLLS